MRPSGVNKRIWTTAARFLIILACGIVLLSVLPPKIYRPLEGAVGVSTGWVLRKLGAPVEMEGPTSLTLPLPKGGRTEFRVEVHCLGLHAFVPFVALVLALHGVSLGRRLLGLAAGIVTLWFANLTRIVVTILLAIFWGLRAYDTLHNLLWQVGLSLFAVGCGVAFAIWAWRE